MDSKINLKGVTGGFAGVGFIFLVCWTLGLAYLIVGILFVAGAIIGFMLTVKDTQGKAANNAFNFSGDLMRLEDGWSQPATLPVIDHWPGKLENIPKEEHFNIRSACAKATEKFLEKFKDELIPAKDADGTPLYDTVIENGKSVSKPRMESSLLLRYEELIDTVKNAIDENKLHYEIHKMEHEFQWGDEHGIPFKYFITVTLRDINKMYASTIPPSPTTNYPGLEKIEIKIRQHKGPMIVLDQVQSTVPIILIPWTNDDLWELTKKFTEKTEIDKPAIKLLAMDIWLNDCRRRLANPRRETEEAVSDKEAAEEREEIKQQKIEYLQKKDAKQKIADVDAEEKPTKTAPMTLKVIMWIVFCTSLFAFALGWVFRGFAP